MKPKSPIVSNLDYVQAVLVKVLTPLGFSRKGRTFRRQTEPGLLQVIALQAGPFEIGPPLPEPVKHLREDFYGKFTVNLGIFVDEIYERNNPPISQNKVISDAHCFIRTRLGHITEREDIWWSLLHEMNEAIEEISSFILQVGIPFLDRFRSRDLIVSKWQDFNDSEILLTNVARLDVAMILLRRNDLTGATKLFQEHLDDCKNKSHLPHVVNHIRYVKELAAKLGIGSLS